MTHRRAGAHAPRSIAALLALLLPLTAATLLAEPVAATAAEQAPADSTGAPKSASEVEAFDLAKESGERVEVIDLRTEYVETYANPDGSLTQKQFALPVWTRYDGIWRRTDDTVTKREDGTIGPTATFGITFSGGGDGPLVAMERGGKKLALSWPAKLPEPVLGENTALYPSVLPGVDLKLIAKVNGFAQHLTVTTPEAAANSALKSIKLGITTEGVTLDDTAGDQLLAKDSTGQVVFSAPKPKMWEQPEQPDDPVVERSASLAKSATSVKSVLLVDEPEPAPQQAPVAADVTANTLILTPDPALLASATQFPLVIDPVFTEGYREKWAVVYSDAPNGDFPNGAGWNSSNPADEPRVGYNGSGDLESFFAMNTNGLHGATIRSATFTARQTYSWGCSPSAAGPTELWTSRDIATTPTWNTRGTYWGYKLDARSFAHGNPTYCPGTEGVDFQSSALTAYVQDGADKDWDPLVFGLRVPDSYHGNVNSFKRFENNPVLEVDYNFEPVVRHSEAFEGNWAPGADGLKSVPCGGTIGNSGLAMTANVYDQDLGKVTAYFHVRDAANNNVPFPTNWQQVSNGSTAKVTVPSGVLSKAGTYSWQVYAQDEENTKSDPPTPWCKFTVDNEGPAEPVKVTRSDNNPFTVATPAREPLSVKLKHTATDLAGFCWRIDRPISVSSTPCEGSNWVPLAAGANEATITVVPIGWPESTLYVLAFDKAGNSSPTDGALDVTALHTVRADFVYPAGENPLPPFAKATKDLNGDLNGDGYTDMLAAEPGGGLRVYTGDGTGNVQGSIIGSSGWGGALIAHGGDFTNFVSPTDSVDGYEDAIVRLASGGLYLYAGNGQGAFTGRRDLKVPSRLGAAGWTVLQQIVAPGDLNKRTDTGYVKGNDLLGLECTRYTLDVCTRVSMRLYSGQTKAGDSSPNQNEAFNLDTPTEIAGPGGAGWLNHSIVSVADLNGDQIKDIVTRDSNSPSLYLHLGRITNGVYNVGGAVPEDIVYASAGWGPNSRILATGNGNVQGTVVNKTVTDDGTVIKYKVFQPKAGDELGDVWATTPADPDYLVNYTGSSGTTTTTCPSGCLLLYPGGPTGVKVPYLVGLGGWSTSIKNIF
ncbi:VCBS repeat-containing protein [Streptomyces sp. H27-H1]|uniref:FG-GAP repeat domain-containing protein n=1 Tax=Streptomyces sp. H27-H1 TaxID=2996461 RepID=UPI002271FB88|nr:VCBS repeat-containing protein [Streptomyces sp. H27-H1]MCY0931004.1 VCBS repeat-containing protein [Streptomyces sp. H27-H1]